MKADNNKQAFIDLVRLGLGTALNHDSSFKFQDSIDWLVVKEIAEQQGLSAVVLDGIEGLKSLNVQDVQGPPQELLLEWIGETLQSESIYENQQKDAASMANLFQNNGIRTYVLKGAVVAECYPKPSHRASVDMDCYLLPERSDFDAWDLGNSIIKSKGYNVDTDFYKNSTFFLPNLMVENHRFLTPFRGDKRMKSMEIILQGMLHEDKGEDRIEGTSLYRPPVMVTALFLIEHAYSHFLHEGLTWRMILDWMMFSKRHHKEIDWYSFDAIIEEFGFRRFYITYNRLGQYMMGEIGEKDLNNQDLRMLSDVWADLDLNETNRGVKGKIAMAGNTIKAWRKYKYFTDISMIHGLYIRVKGFLFERHPSLDKV